MEEDGKSGPAVPVNAFESVPSFSDNEPSTMKESGLGDSQTGGRVPSARLSVRPSARPSATMSARDMEEGDATIFPSYSRVPSNVLPPELQNLIL